MSNERTSATRRWATPGGCRDGTRNRTRPSSSSSILAVCSRTSTRTTTRTICEPARAFHRKRSRGLPAIAAHGLSALVCLLPASAPALSIVNSKHNLSVTGPGNIRASKETEICIFCHTPHNATSDAPLWNRFESGVAYVPYSSSTIEARIGQPTGASKLCLSCHDGTVALGLVRSREKEIPFTGGVVQMPPGPSRLGTDLADDHPISFRYDRSLAQEDGELQDPISLNREVRLDRRGELQCTSCHDPHDDRYGKFLVRDNYASALCLQCHKVTGWDGAAHRTSNAAWNEQAPDPWPHTELVTVDANACENCHAPHAAGTKERLLNFAIEEDNCNRCHNGNVAAKDVEAEFQKMSTHPVDRTAGIHLPNEDPVNPTRHVECVDCHNTHAAAAGAGVDGVLRGVSGINVLGNPVNPIRHEYELCFRCHADSVERGRAFVNRQYAETNTRREFDPANESYHPVVEAGRNPDVPSLIGPYRTTSLIACTDCHNNDAGPATGGRGPAGPHGSVYEPLLEKNLALTDGASGDQSGAALCYKCHSRDSVLGNESFPTHREHSNEGIACVTCHDPHGSRLPHLINFNPDYASPLGGALQFEDGGRFTGTCTLSCHGKGHDHVTYEPGRPGSLQPQGSFGSPAP
jgi:predicted CXXCH cytochrome family protein